MGVIAQARGQVSVVMDRDAVEVMITHEKGRGQYHSISIKISQ